jgi:hypothetical protein
MKFSSLSIFVLVCVCVFVINVKGQTCTNGKINGIYYTSCFLWVSGNGTLNLNGTNYHNDWRRLQDAIDASLGKLIFNEGQYVIDDELTVHSYRILEGTGRRSQNTPDTHITTRVIQKRSDKAIFKIGESVSDVSIRDMALEGISTHEGMIGILAEGGHGGYQYASLGFQFSNLKFSKLDKGIYVNAIDSGHEWQFDNIRLDHAFFENCLIGVHINSHNSGWFMSSLDFLVPDGDEDGDEENGNYTYGVFLERSTYTSMHLLVGNGDGEATALIKVKNHANLNIQNTVAEGFREDIVVDEPGAGLGGRTYPINLMNNVFLNRLRVKDSTVISIGNQWGFTGGGIQPVASGYSQIYSIGDKFCFEGDSCETNRSYDLQGNAQMMFSTNKYKTEINTGLTLGGGKTITLGSIDQTTLLSTSSPNGTLYYCTDCSQSSNCATGTGALAKRLRTSTGPDVSSWVCN